MRADARPLPPRRPGLGLREWNTKGCFAGGESGAFLVREAVLGPRSWRELPRRMRPRLVAAGQHWPGRGMPDARDFRQSTSPLPARDFRQRRGRFRDAVPPPLSAWWGEGAGRAGSRDPDQAPPPKGLPAPVALDLGLVGGSFAVFADCLII